MHQVEYRTYPANESEKKIIAECNGYANIYGDYRDQVRDIEFKGGIPYDSFEEAHMAIRDMDNGWYHNLAVRFRDISGVKSAKVEDIDRRIRETREKKMAYEEEHDIHTFKSQYIGCKGCGSKLSIKHIRGNSCPLCRNELRSETTMNTLKGYEDKITALTKAKREEQKKQLKKCPIMWLVKFEFHC